MSWNAHIEAFLFYMPFVMVAALLMNPRNEGMITNIAAIVYIIMSVVMFIMCVVVIIKNYSNSMFSRNRIWRIPCLSQAHSCCWQKFWVRCSGSLFPCLSCFCRCWLSVCVSAALIFQQLQRRCSNSSAQWLQWILCCICSIWLSVRQNPWPWSIWLWI